MELVDGILNVDDLDGFLARLGKIGDQHGVTIQAFDARYVVDRAHLEKAVELADRAFERGENIADDRAVEILLYAAGRRQINRALELGVDTGECPAVVAVDGTGDEAAAADAIRRLDVYESAATLGEYDPDRVREWFDLGEPELATGADLSELVRERVALLVVEK